METEDGAARAAPRGQPGGAKANRALREREKGPRSSGGRERLGLDCDGVLSNFARFTLARINRELGTSLRLRDWRPIVSDDPLVKAAAAIVWRMMGDPEIWAQVPPYPGTARRVAALRERYDIYVVTAMPPQFADVRAEWLLRHGVPHERLVAVDDPAEKVGVAQELGLCAFVEDLAPTAEDMAAAGIESYLVRRPWNAELPLKNGVRRGTWGQILARLLGR